MNRQRTLAHGALVLVCGLIVTFFWSSRPDIPIESDGEILEAIKRGDLPAIQEYLSRGGLPDRRIAVYERTMPMLEAGVIARDEDIALALIDAGADIGAGGVTPPLVASSGLSTVLQRMLAVMPVPTSIENPGVLSAALEGYYDTVQVYLRHAMTMNRDDEWATEFNKAAGGAMFGGYDDVARLLLESGAALNDPDQLLHTAARFGSPGMVRYLLSRGMDPTDELRLPSNDDRTERTPIELAWVRHREAQGFREWAGDRLDFEMEFAALGNDDAAYVLYELNRAGARLDEVDLEDVARDGLAELAAINDARERLLGAARIGYWEVVEEVLSTAQMTEQALRDAVVTALKNNHDDIARLLLDSGAPAGGGPLHVSTTVRDAASVRLPRGR